jgi:hypothetical protein
MGWAWRGSWRGAVAMDTFSCPDFVVATGHGKVVRLSSKSMDHASKAGRRGTTLVEGFDGNVLALDAHPQAPIFAAGTDAGTLQLWHIETRHCLAQRTFTFPPPTKPATQTDAALSLTLLASPHLTSTSSSAAGAGAGAGAGASAGAGGGAGRKPKPEPPIEGMDEREQIAAIKQREMQLQAQGQTLGLATLTATIHAPTAAAAAAAAALAATASAAGAGGAGGEHKVGEAGAAPASAATAAAAAAASGVGRCVVRCVKFSPNGEICVLGFTNGVVKIVSTLLNAQGCALVCGSRAGSEKARPTASVALRSQADTDCVLWLCLVRCRQVERGWVERCAGVPAFTGRHHTPAVCAQRPVLRHSRHRHVCGAVPLVPPRYVV